MLKTTTSVINASQITGVLPVVNGGTGVTTSTGTGSTVLSTAPSFAGDVTLSTGNIVVGTIGKGIDFSATPGAGTSELLNDYEEGTWTPTQGGGLTVIGTFSSTGTYTKVGRMVNVTGTVNGSTSVAIGGISEICAGLPFTVGTAGIGAVGGSPSAASTTCFSSSISIFSYAGVGPTTTIAFTVTYFV